MKDETQAVGKVMGHLVDLIKEGDEAEEQGPDAREKVHAKNYRS